MVLSHSPVLVLYISFYVIAGEALAAAILSVIEQSGLSISNCVGQAYDGASNMSGTNTGTAAHIQRKNPRAVYSHCRSHVLNLSLVKSCKNVQAVSKCVSSYAFIQQLLQQIVSGRSTL